MFSQVFLFFLECFGKILNVFRGFKIDTNLTYYDFLVFSVGLLIMFQLLRVVRGELSEEYREDSRFLRNMQRYDEQKVRDNLKIKDEKRDMNRRKKKWVYFCLTVLL